MAKKQKLTLSKDARRMKRRIRKTRSKAQWVGFFYLIGTILLTALACLPTLNINGMGLFGMPEGTNTLFAAISGASTLDYVRIALYAIMILVVVINLFKSFSKLGWLYKKKASKTYGLNRNVYAMQSMGKLFSNSFAIILINNFLIVLLSGSYAGGLTNFDAFKDVLINDMFINLLPNIAFIIAVGVVFHLLCGWLGAKASLFTTEEGVGVVEQKRQVGRFASLFRNILQIVVALAIPYLVLKLNVVDAFVGSILGTGATAPDSILAILQLVIVLCWLVLIKHATATTEYNAEGADGAGMKNFTVFIFFTLVASAAMYFMNSATYGMFDFANEAGLCAVALLGISFVMFIIQVLMRKAPGLPEEKDEDVPEDVELDEEGNPIPVVEDTDDVDVDYFFMDSYVF